MRLLIITKIVLTFFFFSLSQTAWADAVSGALVTQVKGSASLQGKDGKPFPVKAFAKLQTGDKLSMGADAKIQVVYLNGGRQETWVDAAQLEVGATETKLIGQGKPPLVNILPPYLLQTLTRSPDVIATIQNRQGMVRLRSITAEKHLADVKAQYEELRQAAPPDDITPEVHLLVSLDRLKAYGEIKEALKEMTRRQPDNPDIKNLYEIYNKP